MSRLVDVLLLVVAGAAVACSQKHAESRMEVPPEWAPHEAMWLGWSDEREHRPVQIEIVRALTPTVPVRMLVTSPEHRTEVEQALAAAGVPPDRVSFVTHPVWNAWIRDAGPRFLSDGRRLAVADFAWSWYGYPPELSRTWKTRAGIDDDIAKQMGLPMVSSALVAEGGGIEVSSSMLMTYKETALQRNPGVALETIEAEYLRVYGKDRIIWLSRSPLADRVTSGPKIANYVGWGANGHIDEYVRFVNDSTVVIAQVSSEDRDSDPLTRADHDILAENLAELRAFSAKGPRLEIVTLPTPTLRYHMTTRPITEADKKSDLGRVALRDFAVGDEVHFVPALSYANFVLSNGVVLVAAYWREGLPLREREKDELARATLQRLFPDRRVIQIHPLAINRGGGGMHCMTQQQPAITGRTGSRD